MRRPLRPILSICVSSPREASRPGATSTGARLPRDWRIDLNASPLRSLRNGTRPNLALPPLRS